MTIDFDLPAGLELERPIERALMSLSALPPIMTRRDAAVALQAAAARWAEASRHLNYAAERLRAADAYDADEFQAKTG